jgi:YjbE family integral membrane protein
MNVETAGFSWDFIIAFLSIVFIDLILAGDNAVVIAMAVRSLPPPEKRKGIILGAGAAVLLRIFLTFFAAKLLMIGFIKFLGGVLIAWIAVRLSMEGSREGKFQREAKTLGRAIGTIMIADVVMSTDNVLAIAGASRGNFLLLLFGLGLSIPLVVFTSNVFSVLIDKYPILLYIGVGILGRVAGEMVITDPYIQTLLDLDKISETLTQAMFAIGVIVAGIFWKKWKA